MTRSEKATRAIREARTEAQVIGAVRDYLDSLDAADCALLPAEILVLGLTSAEEMIQSALQTLHTRRESGGGSGSGVLNETTLVFTTAARRLAVLAKDAV